MAGLCRPQPEPTVAENSGAGCGTGPRPPRLTSSKRRRNPRIVAHGFGVVWRVESSVGNILGVVTEGIELAPGVHDVLGVVHLDHAVVVLIADQGMTVSQAHGARGQWASAPRQVAAGSMTGEVLPHDGLVLIDLDNTVVIRVRHQRGAVLQPAGKSDPTHRITVVRVAAAILPDNIAAERDRARDLDGAVVILVADQNVTVLEKLGAVRVVELIGTVAGDTRGAILPDDSIGCDINLNDSLVRLICDEHVAIGKPCVLYGNVELIGTATSHSKLPILPNNVSTAVDQYNAVVGAAAGIGAVGSFGLTARSSGASH